MPSQIQNKIITTSPITISGPQDGAQEFMGTIAGVAVAEYDKLLGSYKQDLEGMNAKKSELREDRDKLQVLQYRGTTSSQPLKDGQEPPAPAVDGKVFSASDFGKADKPGTPASYFNKYGVGPDSYKTLSSGDVFVPDNVWESLKEKIDGKIQNVNSDSEIRMIYFQSLMDSRKQAMLMLSNMVSSENSTKMAIIQNLKG